jgi:hypothetical protein
MKTALVVVAPLAVKATSGVPEGFPLIPTVLACLIFDFCDFIA